MSERVVIIGGGVGGLMAALAFGRAGHAVTVLERDPLPPTADAEEAFAAERRGAPQVHQTHGFLARLQVLLRDRYPDVLEDLLAVGGSVLPMTRTLGEPQPGDEDLRVVKFLGIPGDGGTLSVTLAVRTEDRDLRAALSDPDRFDLACRLLPGPDLFFRHGPLEPIGGVLPMTGLLNRIRRFTADGEPTVVGFHALGDAHTTTNPLYGRGCALAAVQATLLADAAAAHPGDPRGRALDYEAACTREVEPWFEASVQMDKMGADPSGRGGLGGGAGGEAAKGLVAVFAAAATDPIIGRGIARFMNLLVTPAGLMSDGAFLGRVAEVMADPDAYPAPEQPGPTRTELLDSLTATAA